MQILFTATARRQLLELVAALRSRNRAQAARLVEDVEERLAGLVEDGHGWAEADPGRAVATASDSVRFYWWTRADAVWVLTLSHPLLRSAQ